jgi:Rieske 2Fe-2S family protein
MKQDDIQNLLGAQPRMRALAQPFYADPDIYARDIETVYLRSWLYAGHQSEIPEPGDWFLYELERESVIIVRDDQGAINALVNVCRHRGSRVCLKARGHSKRLACRYHGWVYGLDGALLAARQMDDDFDLSAHGLRRIHCEVLHGMIFINFADDAAPFEPVRAALGSCLDPYQLGSAKVARRREYPMQANWKLAVENYTECYHCAPAHPEYSRGHILAHPDLEREAAHAKIRAAASACGLGDREVNRIYLNAEGFGADYAYERYALIRDHLTGSEDGQPVAPLLGGITDYFGGCTDFQVGPVTFALAYCDYVVIYAFRPLGLDRSTCDITWLVRGDAVEGQDYDLDRLTWLWDVTTEADKRIIEHNAAGVNSRYYRPGPYSKMETYTWKFTEWYLEALRCGS